MKCNLAYFGHDAYGNTRDLTTHRKFCAVKLPSW